MDHQTEVFTAVDLVRRKPSIASIGGFRPEPGLKSWFGGRFWLPSGFSWPEAQGETMLGVLQVVVAELPAVPSRLSQVAVLQVFMANRLPVGKVKNGDGFLVLTHADVANLAPYSPPTKGELGKPFQIRWHEGPPEGPCWEEVFDHVPSTLLEGFVNQVPECFQKYYDRYPQHAGTKVGGWASYIQGIADLPGDFVLQISTEEKPQFFVGDNGNFYFYLDGNDQWWCTWDCY